MKIDAKTIAALASLAVALAGGVELRVQVGLLASKVDRIEAELSRARAVVVAHSATEDAE
jgi:hypothetical protein